jgi:hypothetical protein
MNLPEKTMREMADRAVAHLAGEELEKWRFILKTKIDRIVWLREVAKRRGKP